jgi:hypothetical protein
MRYSLIATLLSVFSLLTLPFGAGERANKNSTASDLGGKVYLQPRLQAGQVLGNIFSRTIAYKADGLEIPVRRTSGTGVYTVLEGSGEKLVFNGVFLYDGRPESRAKTEMRNGGRIICYDDKCAPATDASGLLYNPFIWGDPTGILRQATSWEVSIPDPWELGPPGRQTVTVFSADPINHSIILRREGRGEGFFADDKTEIPVTKGGRTYYSPGSAWTFPLDRIHYIP